MWNKNDSVKSIKLCEILNTIININLSVSDCTVNPEKNMISGKSIKTMVLDKTLKPRSLSLQNINIVRFSPFDDAVHGIEIK